LEETRVDAKNKKEALKNRKNHNYPEAQNWTSDKQQTQKIQTTEEKMQASSSHCNYKRPKDLIT